MENKPYTSALSRSKDINTALKVIMCVMSFIIGVLMYCCVHYNQRIITLNGELNRMDKDVQTLINYIEQQDSVIIKLRRWDRIKQLGSDTIRHEINQSKRERMGIDYND